MKNDTYILTHLNILILQHLRYKDCESDLLEVKTGIPPESILGPYFFSKCINAIVNSTSKLYFFNVR